MSIEHFTPVSSDESAINDYENCFYACRFCNASRSITPVLDGEGRKLLNPCAEAWADHFVLADDDRLAPLDPDAGYTEKIYDLNEPRKVQVRRLRRERLEGWTRLVARGPHVVTALLAQSEVASSVEQRRELIEASEAMRACVRRAAAELLRYTAVPLDADTSCRCGNTDYRVLPLWLLEQTVEAEPQQ